AGLFHAAPSCAHEWVGSWASAQMLVDPKDGLPASATDITLRQLIRTSIGGSRIRLKVSNAFGRTPLTIAGVNIARAASPGSSRIAATDRPVTFAGARTITIPEGAEYVSDPLDLTVAGLTTLAISMHITDL